MGWEAGKAPKLKSSKSRASGTGWFVVADGGRAKALLDHESQSNEGVGLGRGSETVCFFGTHSRPRGFLTAGSSEMASDKRLFREREGDGMGSSRTEAHSGESG